jgi:hypothetical protein
LTIDGRRWAAVPTELLDRVVPLDQVPVGIADMSGEADPDMRLRRGRLPRRANLRHRLDCELRPMRGPVRYHASANARLDGVERVREVPFEGTLKNATDPRLAAEC